eukprot:gene15513-18424_t
MKVRVYDPDGVEFFYEFKSDLPFSSHISHLYQNLMALAPKADDDEVSSHYSLQEATSGAWIEASGDAMLVDDAILFFKLLPLHNYIAAVEAQLIRAHSPTSLRMHIENEMQTQMASKGRATGLALAIERLHTHLSLLLLKERKKNPLDHVFISADLLCRIIRIVFKTPSVASINLLVDYLQTNNSNVPLQEEHAGASTPPILMASPSLLPQPIEYAAKSSSPSNHNYNHHTYSLSSPPATMSHHTNHDMADNISLFTLIDQSIKTCSTEFNHNFYLFLLANNDVDLVIQTLRFINNMYLLSPNPVNYVAKLHREIVLAKIIVLDGEKVQHQMMFADLWNSALSLFPFGGVYSHRWLLLGFRGPSPADDLKLTGVLALRNLAHFAKHFQPAFQHLLMTQTQRELPEMHAVLVSGADTDVPPAEPRSYPLAVIGISITFTLANIFRIGRESIGDDASLWDIAFSDVAWFDECYVATINLFESLWHSKAHSFADFPLVLKLTRLVLERLVQESPKSAGDFVAKLRVILMTRRHEFEFDLSEAVAARFVHLQECRSPRLAGRPVADIYRADSTLSDEYDENLARQQLVAQEEFSCKKLTSFFGEQIDMRVDTRQYQFSSTSTLDPNNNNNTSVNSLSSSSLLTAIEKRSHRLKVFFGEWFETEHVESERNRSSAAIEADKRAELAMSLNSALNTQPESARIVKLNKFFGERVPISKRTLGASSEPPYLAISDDTDSQSSEPIRPRSPEEAKSNFKAQKLLGERIDVRKEREALNFAPQPSHVSEHKLHKLFGEMVPTQRQPVSPVVKEDGSKTWRRGVTARKDSYHSSVIIPLSSTPPVRTSPSSSISPAFSPSTSPTSYELLPSSQMPQRTPISDSGVSTPSDISSPPVIIEPTIMDELKPTHHVSPTPTNPTELRMNNTHRSEFKAQRMLGERMDVSKESTTFSFNDQPPTVKVDKLIQIFGEKVSFSVSKRKDSSPNLSSLVI